MILYLTYQDLLHTMSRSFLYFVVFVGLLALPALAGNKAISTRENKTPSKDRTTASVCELQLATRDQLFAQLLAGNLSATEYANVTTSLAVAEAYLPDCCTGSTLTYWTTNYLTPALKQSVNTNAVCGYDFNTYTAQNASLACVAGIYHPEACFSRYTNLYCYELPTQEQEECIFELVLNLVNSTINPAIQLPDPYMLSRVAPCTSATTQYRQSDGSCNNVGAVPFPGQPSYVNARYSGAVENKFVHEDSWLPENQQEYIQTGPNPRDVSNALFTQSTPVTNNVGANGLTMAWVNFFVHDFMYHTTDYTNPYAIPISADDPFYGSMVSSNPNTEYYMLIPNTVQSTVPEDLTSPYPIYRDNTTAWFDVSQLYGRSNSETTSLRTLSGGQLRMGADNLLPNSPPIQYAVHPFLTGDYRVNFHPGLTAITTLWAREHNNIASILQAQNPTWTDEQLFQTARLIVCAEVIKIHSLEWTNQLGQNPGDQYVTKSLVGTFGEPLSTDELIMTHVVSEEFVTSYHWHSFVPPALTIRNPHTGAAMPVPSGVTSIGDGQVDYVAQFQDTKLIRSVGIEPVLAGLAYEYTGAMRFHNLAPGLQNMQHRYLLDPNPEPFTQPNCQAVPGLDFAVIDIVRERERGLPRYLDFRNLVGQGNLPEILYFDDIAQNAQDAAALADLYQWQLNQVDTMVGIYGEHLYPNQGFPLTFAAGFTPFVWNRAMLDRFYHDDFTADLYTEWGMERINCVDLTQILCDNANICNVANRNEAFLLSGWTGPVTTSAAVPTKFLGPAGYIPTYCNTPTYQGPFLAYAIEQQQAAQAAVAEAEASGNAALIAEAQAQLTLITELVQASTLVTDILNQPTYSLLLRFDPSAAYELLELLLTAAFAFSSGHI